MAAGLVIFDNDGVVVDSETVANRVLAGLLTEHGDPTTLEESVRRYMGGTLADVRAEVEHRSGRVLPPAFEDLYHERLFAAFSTELRPVPGIAAVLEHMTRPYCLASSGTTTRIVRSLTLTGLLGHFEGRIFSAEEVARGKPAPDLFLHAATAMAVDPRRCVVVEDSPLGVAAGRAAGMTVLGYCALTPPEALAGAHATFARMEELLPLLERVTPS